MSVKLVFGWKIEYDDLIDYLRRNEAGSCKTNQCVCGPKCWNNASKYTFPKNVYSVRASNYATSDIDLDFAISLLPADDNNYSALNIACALKHEAILNEAKILVWDIYYDDRANELEKPRIFAMINI